MTTQQDEGQSQLFVEAREPRNHEVDRARLMDTIEKIRAMVSREKSYVNCCYLRHEDNERKSKEETRDDSSVVTAFTSHSREQLCHWFFGVADSLDLNRKVVSVSCSYLDRFLASFPAPHDTRIASLAACASFFLAVKLNASKTTFVKVRSILPELSAGQFTIQHIVTMEHIMLQRLRFLVNPPTAACFVQMLMGMIPLEDMSSKMRQDVYERACFFTELATLDVFFIGVAESKTAVSAVLNAIEFTSTRDIRWKLRLHVQGALQLAFPHILHSSSEMRQLRSRLREVALMNREETKYPCDYVVEEDKKRKRYDGCLCPRSPKHVTSRC